MNNEMTYEALIERLKSTDEKMNEVISVADMVAKVVSNLVTERVNKNMTQRELAKVSGIKQSAIARMEKMQVVPRLDTVAKLAYHLGMNLHLGKYEQKTIIINIEQKHKYTYEETKKIEEYEQGYNLDKFNTAYGFKNNSCCSYS